MRDELAGARARVADAARQWGAAPVAVPGPVLAPTTDGPGDFSPGDRYAEIDRHYGAVARQSLMCALHVHVEVADDEEGVAVIDRVRPWIPVLVALGANSPYWHGIDTGYASWRSRIWNLWPTGGPAELFHDAATYHAVVRDMVRRGSAPRRRDGEPGRAALPPLSHGGVPGGATSARTSTMRWSSRPWPGPWSPTRRTGGGPETRRAPGASTSCAPPRGGRPASAWPTRSSHPSPGTSRTRATYSSSWWCCSPRRWRRPATSQWSPRVSRRSTSAATGRTGSVPWSGQVRDRSAWSVWWQTCGGGPCSA